MTPRLCSDNLSRENPPRSVTVKSRPRSSFHLAWSTTKNPRSKQRRSTSRNMQETDGSRHNTAPSGAQNALCGLDFRKVRQILLRLRKKISSIEAKEPKLWMFEEEGQSISSLGSVKAAYTRPETRAPKAVKNARFLEVDYLRRSRRFLPKKIAK